MIARRVRLARPIPTFGRRMIVHAAPLPASESSGLIDDLRLFALTFAGGFVFMSVYLA